MTCGKLSNQVSSVKSRFKVSHCSSVQLSYQRGLSVAGSIIFFKPLTGSQLAHELSPRPCQWCNGRKKKRIMMMMMMMMMMMSDE